MRPYLLSLILSSSVLIGSEAKDLVEKNCSYCHENKSLNLVSIESMSQFSPADLLYVLETGKMSLQAQGLSANEKELIANYLTKQKINNVDNENLNSCNKEPLINNYSKKSEWTSWGFDHFNTRFQPVSNINASNLNKLNLKWSFGLKETDTRGQPIVIGDIVFISGKSLHAIDKETGCSYWSFTPKSSAGFRNSPVFDTTSRNSIYVVDSNFMVYKLNIKDGSIAWKTKIDKEFESNTSSASPVFGGNYLFIPVSTYETVMAIDPNYECCKTSGGIVVINTENGEIKWNHRIEEQAKFTKKCLITRTKKYAPAGSAVWNSPSIDFEENIIFFGTGQSLSLIHI